MTRKRGMITAGLALSLAGCAAITVSADFDPEVDFQTYRTYAWGPADALPTGDPRLDNNPFFDDRMRGAVDGELAERGLTVAPATEADLVVHYHISIRERIDVVTVDREYGYEPGYDTAVREWQEGTLMVDLVDTRTNRVIWRGWAQSDMAGVIDDRDALAERIRKACDKLFTRYPPQ